MNKKVPFMLLAVSTMLLTACDTKVSQEKFVAQLDATKANVTLDSANLDNVHMSNKLNINVIDYKKDEFYINTTQALAIIIPIISKYYTWKEGDKYYHAEEHTITSNNKYSEITKEEFDVYMATGRGEVCAKLNEGITNCDNMLKEQPEGSQYYNVKNSFVQTAAGEYKMTSTMNYKTTEDGEEVEKKRTTIFVFKKNLPVKYTIKDNGETFYKYSFGKAELRKPSEASE